jgi:hypothetical protein
MAEDGGYTNIVIKIRKEISEDDCPDILAGIKVLEKNSFWLILPHTVYS